MKKPAADKKPATAKTTTKRKTSTTKQAPAIPLTDEQRLREAVAPYLSRRLQHLVALNPDALQAALETDDPPLEIQAMLRVLAALLRPYTH